MTLFTPLHLLTLQMDAVGYKKGEIAGLPRGVSEGAAQQLCESGRQVRWHLIDPALPQNTVFP